MHPKPDIFSVAPDVIGQPDRHRWGALYPSLPQALMGDQEVVEAHYQPDPSPMTIFAPRQTAGSASQGCHKPPKRAIPPLHKSCLDGSAQTLQAKPFEEPPRTAKGHPAGNLNDPSGSVSDFDHLGVEQVVGGHKPRAGLSSHLPPATWTIELSQDPKEGLGISVPAIGQEDRNLAQTGDHLSNQAAVCVVRGPNPTHSTKREPIARAV